MAPEFCPDHGELMRAVGAIEANQETMGNDIKAIKAGMEKLVSNNNSSRIRMAEVATKVKVLYGGIGALAMLAAAAAKDICMKKFFGQ